jgi:hypothetical protein
VEGAMHDQIITAYLADFVQKFGLRELDEGAAFERFVNYCVISKLYAEPFEIEDVYFIQMPRHFPQQCTCP